LLALGETEWLYEAEEANGGKHVAVKAAGPARLADPDAASRLEREARAGAAVQHGNLVRTWSSGTAEDGTTYLVMELIEGVTLAELISVHGKLAWREACNYVFQAAVALERLHQAGIVHRDIQPSNLLVDRKGLLKVADFGQSSAALLEGAAFEHPEMAGLPEGAIDYAAPELFDDRSTIGPRVDIYSLGCTFYHALTGTVPYPNLEAGEKIRAHRSVPPEPIRSHVSHVPAELIKIVRKMMTKEPDRRFGSIQEVTDALAALARPQPAYFDRYAILMQRAIAARWRLRDRARQIAEQRKTPEPSATPSS
jgi:eukaryotic-like serine/threonine-protein kinase